MIIDAHVHLPVGEGCDSLISQKEKLLNDMKKNQISRSIVISDSCKETVIGTLDECVELFKETECVNVVGGISLFFDYERQLEKLRKYLNEKQIVGIKLFTGHEAFFLTDEKLKKVYMLACEYNVPVLFHSGWDNSEYSDEPLVTEIARKYPRLKIVCCHCFYPKIEKCRLLVKYPNVFFDISSVADNAEILEEIGEKVKLLIEMAPDRVIFGSDYSCCNQEEHIRFVKRLKLSGEAEEKVLWRNAARVYSLKR